MGKSGRHKKLNKQEKAKTQLKGVKTFEKKKGSVKKLGKAVNVVNPSLKIKRIIIREQLHGDKDGDNSNSIPLTRKHQSIQVFGRFFINLIFL